ASAAAKGKAVCPNTGDRTRTPTGSKPMPSRPVAKTVRAKRADVNGGRTAEFRRVNPVESGEERSALALRADRAVRAPSSTAATPQSALTAASSQTLRDRPSDGKITNAPPRVPTTAPSVLAE